VRLASRFNAGTQQRTEALETQAVIRILENLRTDANAAQDARWVRTEASQHHGDAGNRADLRIAKRFHDGMAFPAACLSRNLIGKEFDARRRRTARTSGADLGCLAGTVKSPSNPRSTVK
jgi:hypothetical protein